MGRCQYYLVCKFYDKTGVTCNKDGGRWGMKMASCYIRMVEKLCS